MEILCESPSRSGRRHTATLYCTTCSMAQCLRCAVRNHSNHSLIAFRPHLSCRFHPTVPAYRACGACNYFVCKECAENVEHGCWGLYAETCAKIDEAVAVEQTAEYPVEEDQSSSTVIEPMYGPVLIYYMPALVVLDATDLTPVEHSYLYYPVVQFTDVQPTYGEYHDDDEALRLSSEYDVTSSFDLGHVYYYPTPAVPPPECYVSLNTSFQELSL